MRVYLVGMPGSGKSAVGRALARRLGLPFVDLDAEVEGTAGLSVREIFEGDGEARFRSLEADALARAAGGPAAVIACGGGLVLDPANRERLRSTGTVVWLRVPAARLRDRVAPDAERPLVRRPEDLDRLLAEREALYRSVAHRVVDAADDPPEEVAAGIAEMLE